MDCLALGQQALRLITLEDRPQEDSTIVPDLMQLIELARVYAFIGSCHRDQDTHDKAKTAFTRAKRVAKRAIEIYDSAIAWGVYLKVSDSLIVNPHTLTWMPTGACLLPTYRNLLRRRWRTIGTGAISSRRVTCALVSKCGATRGGSRRRIACEVGESERP